MPCACERADPRRSAPSPLRSTAWPARSRNRSGCGASSSPMPRTSCALRSPTCRATWRRFADVLVTVFNSGPGIPAEDLPHVFERFYRVEKSRDRASGGAGIGLAIVKTLVELGGGHVGAESAPDATRFWFSLPAVA